MSKQQLTWLVTGTSSGVGRELVLHILARGDKAIATARGRSFSKLADLEARGAATYELDVNASQDDLHAFAKKIIDDHGHVDVIVNNAGYVAMGAEEASTPEKTSRNSNVFAPLNINRAFLPYMRARNSGWIIWIGSQAGWVVQPVFGLYAASKHALRALAVALDIEISPFGLRSVCFELSNFVSNALSPGNRVEAKSRLSAYNDATKSAYEWLESTDGKQPGDTAKAARAIVDVIRGEGAAAERKVPSLIAIGSEAYNNISRELDTARKGLEEWKDLTCSTDF
ncbi:short chain dehydrogenase [Irpex lacteus]|nr:short chain dehydrogenase [Irpex lacteus]